MRKSIRAGMEPITACVAFEASRMSFFVCRNRLHYMKPIWDHKTNSNFCRCWPGWQRCHGSVSLYAVVRATRIDNYVDDQSAHMTWPRVLATHTHARTH